MPQRNAASAYQSQAVQTASQPQILVMLCDRFMLDLRRAKESIEKNDFQEANESLQHAQKITRMLRTSLDPKGFKGGQELLAIYLFLERHLVKANLEKNGTVVEECEQVFSPICEAWRMAVANSETRESEDAVANVG